MPNTHAAISLITRFIAPRTSLISSRTLLLSIALLPVPALATSFQILEQSGRRPIERLRSKSGAVTSA